MPVAGMEEIYEQLATTLREGFATALEDTPLAQIQVENGYVVNPTGFLAHVDIFPAPVARGEESAGFGEMDGEYLITVRARSSESDDLETQKVLRAMLDDGSDLSVAGILLEDETLNGLASSMDVRNPSGFQLFPPGMLVGVTWDVLVIAGET